MSLAATRDVTSVRMRRIRPAQLAEHRAAWLLATPSLIAILLFVVGPTLAVVVMAFTDWQMGQSSFGFAGLDNFAEVFGDRVFRISALNTLSYGLMVTPASVALGLWLAVTIESLPSGRAFFRSSFFLPVVSTTVAMAVVWEFVLHPTLGPVNAALQLLGLPRQNFLSDARMVLPTLAVIGIWENAGFNMVLFMAGLKAIPRDLYEAGAVEGADRGWERFWYITLPLLGPTLVFVVVISFLRSFRVFDTIATLTQGGPRRASEVLLYTIYQEGFVFFRIGYASALSLVFLAILLGLTLLQVRMMEKKVHYS